MEPGLRELVVFLAAAGLVIPVGRRLNISPVLGFLLVGLVVGPFGLGRFTDTWPWLSWAVLSDLEGTRHLAELGVVFLLFMIGLELSAERLWAMRKLVFGLGGLQVIVSGVVIGCVAALWGNSLAASVVLGGCLALSSTAIVIQLLTEQGRFGSPVGRAGFGILLAQDIAVVPILFIVGALGAQGEGGVGWALAKALGQAALAVVLILGIGRVVIRPLFRFVSNNGGVELFVAATLLVITLTALATHAAGLSAALGAFLAGLMFSETEFRHEIEVNIEPFKGLLLGLFFMSVGMGIDVAYIAGNPVWIGASVIGLIGVKLLITAGLARLMGLAPWVAVETGLLLSQGGEFAFIVVGLAVTLALLPADVAQFMLIVVGATMFLTPLLARLARSAGRTLEQRMGDSAASPDHPEFAGLPDERDHVVIVGFGRAGQLLARLLDCQEVPHVAVDLDAERVARMRAEGREVYLGDATRPAMLEQLHLSTAAALAVTMDTPAAAEQVVRAARQLCPQVPILARVHDRSHAETLLALGATHVVPEVVESTLGLGEVLLEHVGLPADGARQLVDRIREEVTVHAPE